MGLVWSGSGLVWYGMGLVWVWSGPVWVWSGLGMVWVWSVLRGRGRTRGAAVPVRRPACPPTRRLELSPTTCQPARLHTDLPARRSAYSPAHRPACPPTCRPVGPTHPLQTRYKPVTHPLQPVTKARKTLHPNFGQGVAAKVLCGGRGKEDRPREAPGHHAKGWGAKPPMVLSGFLVAPEPLRPDPEPRSPGTACEKLGGEASHSFVWFPGPTAAAQTGYGAPVPRDSMQKVPRGARGGCQEGFSGANGGYHCEGVSK